MLENIANLRGAFVGAPGVSLALADALRPGDTFFDCGAFHGWLTRLGSAAVGPTGKVIAFEPSAARAILANNVGKLENVKIEALAVGENSGLARFKTSGDPSDQGSSLTDGDVGQEIEVTSIDDYARNTGLWPDVIKLDVEGFEASALRGAIEALKRVRSVVFEQHTADEDARPILQGAGFVTRNAYTLGPEWPSNTPCTDFIATRPGHWSEHTLIRLFAQVPMVENGNGTIAKLSLRPGRYLFKPAVEADNPHQFVSVSVRSPELDKLGSFASGAAAHWIDRISGVPIHLFADEMVEVRVDPAGAGAEGARVKPNSLSVFRVD